MKQHKIRLLGGLIAGLALAAGLLAAPASAADTGQVKGVVTLTGEPLAGATVILQRTGNGTDYSTYKTTTTAAAGTYSFASRTRLSDFTYRVLVKDPQHRAVSTVRTFNSATSKPLTRNVTMQPAGSISGKVTRADGTPAGRTTVEIVGPKVELGTPGAPKAGYSTFADPKADGSFTFVGLPAGKFTVELEDKDYGYLTECYDDVIAQVTKDLPCASTGGKVTVTGGADTALKDQVVDHTGGRIEGTVTDTSGNPLRNITVSPVPVGATYPSFFFGFDTLLNGRFTATQVVPGDQQLAVSDLRGTWESRWYDSAERADAQVFTVVDGTAVKDLALKLRSNATLSVKAAPGTGRATFTVKVLRKASGAPTTGQVTVSRGSVSKTVTLKGCVGTVTLTGLPAGKRLFHVDYLGTFSTADAATTVYAKIG